MPGQWRGTELAADNYPTVANTSNQKWKLDNDVEQESNTSEMSLHWNNTWLTGPQLALVTGLVVEHKKYNFLDKNYIYLLHHLFYQQLISLTVQPSTCNMNWFMLKNWHLFNVMHHSWELCHESYFHILIQLVRVNIFGTLPQLSMQPTQIKLV